MKYCHSKIGLFKSYHYSYIVIYFGKNTVRASFDAIRALLPANTTFFSALHI